MKRKTAKRAKPSLTTVVPRHHYGRAEDLRDFLDVIDLPAGLTFRQLARANEARNQQAFPECADWTPSDWATALAGETGELCNFIKKLRRGCLVPTRDLAKELADVVTYADHIARHFKIDLGEAVRAKFNEVSERRKSPIRL